MKSNQIVVLLVAAFFCSGLSGCIGSDSFDILPEKKGVPGGLTLACLRSSMYTSMVIEIDHEPGYRPFSSSADMLVERLNSVCDKPSGISVEYNEVDFQHEGAWTAQDVRDKGWEQKDTSPRDGTTLGLPSRVSGAAVVQSFEFKQHRALRSVDSSMGQKIRDEALALAKREPIDL